MSGFGGESIGQTIQNIAGIQQMQDQARMSDILQGMSDMGGSSADMLEKAGSTALRAGMLGQAEKALGNAAQIRQRDAHAKLYQGQALEAEVEADIAKIDQFASVVGLYPDTPAGWEAAKASYLANNPNPTPMEMQVMGTPYRPGIANALKTSFMTAKDKMLLGLKQQQLAAQAGRSAESGLLRQMNLQLRQQELDLAREREDRMRKQGDVKNLPTRDEVAGAESAYKSYLLSQGMTEGDIKSIPAVESEAFSRSLANQARQLVSKGMDYDAAMEQVIADNADRITKSAATVFGFTIPGTGRISVTPRTTASRQQAPAGSGESVTINGQTITRPPKFTDDQWAQYKKAMGVK